MPVYKDEKRCKNSCPKCGASDEDIEWGSLEIDDPYYQEAICNKCGCEFCEIFAYSTTVYNKDE